MATDSRKKERRVRNWQQLLWGKLPLEHETAMFVLVNVLDFLLTYWLMVYGTAGGHRIVEGNPFAQYFLYRWGPVKGMLFFKLGIVVFVCVIAQIVAMKRLETGRWLLRIGTVVVAIVLLYSVTLYFRH